MSEMKEICATLHSPRTLDKIDTSSSRACQAVCKGLYITEGVMGGGDHKKDFTLITDYKNCIKSEYFFNARRFLGIPKGSYRFLQRPEVLWIPLPRFKKNIDTWILNPTNTDTEISYRYQKSADMG